MVLEKWMSPALFDGTTAEDEYYLAHQLSPEMFEMRVKIHRSEYITERDFAYIAHMGMNSVRIPIPYFIFGDRPRLWDASTSWTGLFPGRRSTDFPSCWTCIPFP